MLGGWRGAATVIGGVCVGVLACNALDERGTRGLPAPSPTDEFAGAGGVPATGGSGGNRSPSTGLGGFSTAPPSKGLPGVDAGLSVGIEDSDGDGCVDAAEQLLGGCDGATDAILELFCFKPEESTTVTFRLPKADGGPFRDVTLATPGVDGVIVNAEVSEADAASSSAQVFSSVAPGSEVTFRLQLDDTPPPDDASVSLTSLLVVDGEGTVLAEGSLLIVTDYPCPRTI